MTASQLPEAWGFAGNGSSAGQASRRPGSATLGTPGVGTSLLPKSQQSSEGVPHQCYSGRMERGSHRLISKLVSNNTNDFHASTCAERGCGSEGSPDRSTATGTTHATYLSVQQPAVKPCGRPTYPDLATAVQYASSPRRIEGCYIWQRRRSMRGAALRVLRRMVNGGDGSWAVAGWMSPSDA